ncbi:hypothetical protein B0H11DRAFT_1956343 [Mycena galericulata]|nr:hypothetical protein B0H11DRAFT_1956343 [Mycena galericulata]
MRVVLLYLTFTTAVASAVPLDGARALIRAPKVEAKDVEVGTSIYRPSCRSLTRRNARTGQSFGVKHGWRSSVEKTGMSGRRAYLEAR